MKINNFTLESMSKQNPFKVPEGYFENLTAQIMDSLPENEAKKEPVKLARRKKITYLVYMAAMICGIAFGIRYYITYGRGEINNLSTAQNNSEQISLSEEDILMSSVSNYELYEYLYDSDNNF